MGAKSRGNWQIGMCLKDDCKNRGQCDDCFRFSLYKSVNEESFDDAIEKSQPEWYKKIKKESR